MSYTKIKQLYRSTKNIVEILESGDIHDERYKMLIKTMEVDQARKMANFVRACEDIGIDRVVKEIN